MNTDITATAECAMQIGPGQNDRSFSIQFGDGEDGVVGSFWYDRECKQLRFKGNTDDAAKIFVDRVVNLWSNSTSD